MRVDLICHRDTPARSVLHVGVSGSWTKRGLDLTYVVEGPTRSLVLKPPAKPYRTDGLWRSTCFELFIRAEGNSYIEFNFSPSEQWAAYRFDSYRAGVADMAVDVPPVINPWNEGYALILTAMTDLSLLPPNSIRAIGLSAIIEETDGTKSYWALAHPPGAPDFHHPDCFALELPART